jgi:hypothetical protein
MAGVKQQVIQMIQSLSKEVSIPEYNTVIIRLDRTIQYTGAGIRSQHLYEQTNSTDKISYVFRTRFKKD